MTWWQALVLGIVEGVTEYLPVSSTGHLILAQRAVGLEESEASNAYAICIQSGAIAAVLGLYAPRVRQMLLGLVGRDANGLRLAGNLVVAFLPAAVIGALFDDWIEAVLFGLWPVVVAWVVGGAVILAVAPRATAERPGTGLNELGWKQALVIGLVQCVAMWPGTSRSLATILGGVFVGLALPAAVEFSFLLGLLTLGAATAFSAVKHADEMLAVYTPADMAIGFVAAAVSAAVAVKWMVAWLNRHGLGLFAWWRIGIAAVVAALLVAGVLQP